MARSVEHVDLVIFVRDGGDRGANRELALDFLGIVVEIRLAVVCRTHARGLAGDVEHRLSERSLPRAVLTHQDDIAHVLSGRSCHFDHQPFVAWPRPKEHL